MPAIRRNTTVVLLGALASLLPSAVWSANDVSPTPNTVVVTGITKPSEERKLAFAAPGVVADVAIKDGDVVKKGQILASQDDRQEQFAFKSDDLEAKSDEKINYSKDDLAQKQVILQRKKKLFDEDRAASQSEVDEADLAVKLATAQIALAVLEHQQKGFDAQKEAVKIEQMKIISPIDGIAEKINIGGGEMADPQSRDGAIIVGQWDPLWLEAHLPSSQASQLKMGQELPVRYGDTDQWQSAKIIFFEKVDAASDTELVRLEMANPNNAKLPGLHMQIKLPDTVSAVAAGTGQ